MQAVSDDGNRVFSETDAQLVAADTDGYRDVYEHSGGQTTLLSVTNDSFDGNTMSLMAAAPDGSRVVFGPSGYSAIYERASGTTTPIFPPGDGCWFVTASEDADHVLCYTNIALTPEDDNGTFDLYEGFGGAKRQVATGPQGNGHGDASASSGMMISADGSRIFFQSSIQLVASDTDNSIDVYERTNGTTTTLVSIGPNGGNADLQPRVPTLAGISADGLRVFFVTQDPLVSGDDDSCFGNQAPCTDVYERYNGTITQISTGPGFPSGAVHANVFDMSDGQAVLLRAWSASTSDEVFLSRVASTAGYPRPKAATPIYLPLVVAYEPCGTATATHAAPLAFGSCPAQQSSGQLTVGTPDANSRMPNSFSYIRALRLGDLATPADDSDVRLTASLTDVRNRDLGLTDYLGEVEVRLGLRITDRSTSVSPTPPGTGSDTTQDFTFRFAVGCAATGDATIGSTCEVTTTADTLMPGAVPENRRTIWETGQAQVYDGGADGDADTAGDNAPFMRQGVFAP